MPAAGGIPELGIARAMLDAETVQGGLNYFRVGSITAGWVQLLQGGIPEGAYARAAPANRNLI